MQAAKYAGVTLEAWYRMPWFYKARYLESMSAEAEAERELKRFHDARKS